MTPARLCSAGTFWVLGACMLPALGQVDTDAVANPAELWELRGEDVWNTPAGPKNATLQACDLGLGAGVVKGAFVQLPRYFADTQRVQDLESRLLTCLQNLQGFNAAEIAATPFGKGEQIKMQGLVAYVSGQSRGMTFALPQTHAAERLMYAAGKSIFYFRGGPYDFSCASCHADTGKRIRMQQLPNLTQRDGAAFGFGGWPAYRVSNGQMWGMQQRLNDCFRQQRFPYPGYASEATIALSVYLGVTAQGGVSVAPAPKR
jgi:L-cysteine S-thiosulfotransferase